MKLLKYFVFLIIIPVCAQDYEMKIGKGTLIESNKYEFEVSISADNGDFILTSFQCVFTFLNNKNEITFEYIQGTSELSNPPNAGIGDINNKYLTFASAPGEDLISSEELIVGRFRITSAEAISENPIIFWKFDGSINTILTGLNFNNITDEVNHLSENGNGIFLNISSVTASATTDLNTSPEKTFDGLGYDDGDPNARWAAQPLPQWISYDLGNLRTLNSSKISFYKFNENRIYTYSISVSPDNINWTEVVSNAQSSNSEWTVNTFNPTLARYVRIDVISATNNPDNWANIWEVEFWGITSTEIKNDNNTEVNDFYLAQNYPNPFNPSTTISFSLIKEDFVSLIVFNQLGEKVEELVSETLTAGKHEVRFNAENFASGVYFYKLSTGNFSQTKKMLLIK